MNVQSVNIAGRNKIDYPVILEKAWQQHLAPRDDNAPTVISTFAGCGGSSLGYSMAGYRELLVVEWDDNAVETFYLNFPDIPVYHGDIAKLSIDECLELAGVAPGELDLLDDSPPCQGFSTAGKRDMGDDRNQLFREYIRLLRGLRPKVFVIENVPGLVKGKMKLIFAEIMRELKASGYRVKCKKLNAKYFWVPQSRERLIFIGIRDDLAGDVSYPRAESRGIVVREAFENVRNGHEEWFDKKRLYKHWLKTDKNGNSDTRINLKRMLYDRPSGTVCRTAGKNGTAALTHPVLPRYPTIQELMRVSSFPDKYKFTGIYIHQWACIGNAVPPLFMRSIARHIRIHILDRQREPTNA